MSPHPNDNHDNYENKLRLSWAKLSTAGTGLGQDFCGSVQQFEIWIKWIFWQNFKTSCGWAEPSWARLELGRVKIFVGQYNSVKFVYFNSHRPYNSSLMLILVRILTFMIGSSQQNWEREYWTMKLICCANNSLDLTLV